MLHDQLRHDLPRLPGGGVCVVGAINLQHPGPGHNGLGLAGVHEGAHAVDVAVEDVVLGILVGAIDAFLGKHDGHIGASYTGDIGVIVDGAAHLLLDEIQRLTLCADLLAGDGNAADSLGGALHQAVDMGLAHMPDDHDVVGAVPGGHAHAADIVLKAAGGNLGRDDRKRLGVDIAEVLGRGKADALLQRLGHIVVGKGAHLQVGGGLAPGPSPALGLVLVQILEDVAYIQLFVGLQGHLRHTYFPSLNSAAASSQYFPWASRCPASGMERFFSLDSL